jgi:hypothetical protein
MDCVHFNKPDQGCKIRVGGCGWNNEYCAPAIFGDACEYQEEMPTLEDIAREQIEAGNGCSN